MRKKKKYMIFLLVALVITLGIGFAILSANLAINATVGFQHSKWDVHFENLVVNEKSSNLTKPTVDSNKTTLTFSTTINEPGEFYEFSVDVVNAGTMDAVLDNFVKSPLTKDQEKVIEYTVRSYGDETLKTNTVLHAGYSEKIIVRVEYKYAVDSIEHIDNLHCSLELNYIKRDLEKDYGNDFWTINYTGKETQFKVPQTGTYKLEVWGAQGVGNITYPTETIGGYGAYATGEIILTKDTLLYISVGQEGQKNNEAFNGGGYGQLGGAGGTHIATKSGLLSTLANNVDEILIVAGGGGGNDTCRNVNVSAGGIKGLDGKDTFGGGQTASTTVDCAGSFGQGGASPVQTNQYNTRDSGGGGGSGFYGGDGSKTVSGCGAGGSSYIANKLLTNKVMYCYKCATSDAESTKTKTTDNVSNDPISEYAKMGNGFAKITLLKD